MLNWLQVHYVEIFAVVGACYTAARLIVALTPTPKDDKALEKVGLWLKAIGKAFGLDLTQGITNGKSSTPPGVVSIVVLSGLLAISMSIMLTPGCTPDLQDSPKAELVAAQTTFAAVVRSLATLRKAGKFTGDEINAITTAIHEGDGYLDKWETSVLAGGSASDVVVSFNLVLQKLIDYQLAKGGD